MVNLMSVHYANEKWYLKYFIIKGQYIKDKLLIVT